MVPLYRALVSSYRLSIVTMSLTAAVWPQFAMQVFADGAKSYRYISSYVSKEETTFAFASLQAQAVQSASPSDNWALVSDV